MDVPEFEDLLGRHGEDVSTWPDNRRDAALALLRTSEQARAAMAEAQLLRRALPSDAVRAPDGWLTGSCRRPGNPMWFPRSRQPSLTASS
jgi:hypothetical protein